MPLWLCGAMARTDAEPAKRLIAEFKTPGEQSCGWALVALALADRDKPAALAALNTAIELIDGLVAHPAAAARPAYPITVFTNPAASILPIVEKLAPERLDEVFWKAVALMPGDDAARDAGVPDLRMVGAVPFLARYDRQLADTLLNQAMASAPPGRTTLIRFMGPLFAARRSVDPRAAAAMFESLVSVPENPSAFANQNGAGIPLLTGLIEFLLEPDDEHWKRDWRGEEEYFERPFP
jgi:hypothetical protein